MIKTFEKVIRENLTDHLTANDFPLHYLKYSTVTSGAGLNDKVIFLVFKNDAPAPFLCLKTVRNYAARQAILRNFNNLKTLNTLTLGSPHTHLFAQALYLHDDGENIFSIETACPGKRVKLDKNNLKVVMADYFGFQGYLAEHGNGSMRSMEQLAEETVTKSGFNELDQHKLLEYLAQLPPANISLPRIIQHGDLTLDNLLWSKNGLHIIDYDYVGSSDIPGFDLFGLFHRLGRANLSELCKEYFPEYFEKIGGEFEGGNYRRLFFLYHLIEYTQGKLHNSEDASSGRVISGFERLYP